MRKIKWGVLGTASIAENCMIPGMLGAENAELTAIAGRNADKVKRFKDKFGFKKGYVGYEALLADGEIEAVYIPLPNHLHKEWVIKALNAGKNVLCEKPLGLNEAEVKEMFDTAKQNSVILMEAYAYLHSPYIASLLKDAKEMIGNIRFIDTAFVTQGYKEDIRLYKEQGGGAVYDLGCYCTTLILSLVDSDIAYVNGGCELSDKGVDLLSTVGMRFDNGVRAAFTVGMILGEDSNDRMDRLHINGTKGYITSDVEYNQSGKVCYRIVSEGKETVREVECPVNYTLEAEQMGYCIEGKETTLVSEEFSLRNAKLMDSILAVIQY